MVERPLPGKPRRSIAGCWMAAEGRSRREAATPDPTRSARAWPQLHHLRRLAGHIVRPPRHERGALVEVIGSGVGAAHLVADDVATRRLCHQIVRAVQRILPPSSSRVAAASLSRARSEIGSRPDASTAAQRSRSRRAWARVTASREPSPMSRRRRHIAPVPWPGS